MSQIDSPPASDNHPTNNHPTNNNYPNHRNNRGQREQKFPPSTHLYHQGRLVNVYLSWGVRPNLIAVPHQRVYKMTEFYPLDLAYLFQEMQGVVESKNVRNYTFHIYKRDWDVSPHLFFKIGMPQKAYEHFVSGGSTGTAPQPPPPSLPRNLPLPPPPPPPPPPLPGAAPSTFSDLEAGYVPSPPTTTGAI